MITAQELDVKIQNFVQVANENIANHWAKSEYHGEPYICRAEYLSDKWVRIVRQEKRNDGKYYDASVFAFICIKDNVTKALGQVKVGDIHKPANFKTPAKHARANIFEEDFQKCLTPFGIVYLK